MPKFIDLTDRIFGRYTVVRRAASQGLKWVVACECGTIKEVFGSSLRTGLAKSCGCRRAGIMKRMRALQPKLSEKEAEHRKLINSRLYNLNIKIETLTHYGPNHTLRCSAEDCRVEDVDMLTLDHINDDGADDRKYGIGYTGVALYGYLKRKGYPEGFQTLCCNHQSKKELIRRRTLAQTQETQ